MRMMSRSGLALLALVAGAGALATWIYAGPGPAARRGGGTDVILPHGSSTGQIADALKAAGVIRSREVFYLAAKLGGAGRRLKAGEYMFASTEPMAEVLSDIAQGKIVKRFVAIPEGWTSDMVADAIRAEPVLVGSVEAPPEGSILPDSYPVQRGEDRAEVVQKMRDARDALLAQLWAARAPDLPLKTPEEAVTLASIVEKETGIPGERPRIAAVFENRLRQGIKLESDPTIIYGISRGRPLGRGITMKELVTATPYNTYRIVGLPPTPIANPGRAAIAAVLNPPKSGEMFFVADGTGGHVFATTFAEHAANVAKWRAIEQQRACARSNKMTISGMTGFGRSEASFGAWSWAVEARSVNGRNLEIRFRGPPGFEGLERAAREGAQARFQRGQVTLGVQAKRAEGQGAVRLNLEQLERYLAAGAPYIAKGQVATPSLDGLLGLRGVIEAADAIDDPDAQSAIEAAIAASIDAALEGLAAGRAEEGASLAIVLSALVEQLGALTAKASALAGGQPAIIKARFEKRLRELAGEAASEERILQEAAAMAIKADVQEELDRLRAHVAAARTLLLTDGAVGRKLDFLTQEFMREANTLCSKSASSALTSVGLDLKATIEQFREQVQNVE